MKTVLKPGKYSFRHTCSNCKCLYAFTKKDCNLVGVGALANITETRFSVTCPECGKKDFVLLEKKVD